MTTKLNKEAIDEIMHLLNEVKDVVRLLNEFGINIDSDCWSATTPINHDYENILSWSRKDFETLDMSDIESFSIGGNIVTGSEHQYKDKTIIAPKELAEVQGDIFERYLLSVMNSISLKHFKLKLNEPYGLINNYGWEHYFDIEATIQESAVIDNDIISEYLEEIDDEWDDCDCIYKALTLVLGTQEQDKWDDIYYYIRHIIEDIDKNENNEYKSAKESIIEDIKWRRQNGEKY